MLVGLLSWLVPGLGHYVAGERARGWILMVTVAVTFWGGISVAGAQSTVQPRVHKLWFMAQICAGGHTLTAYGLGQWRESRYPDERAGYAEEDVAVIYTGVAGLLSLLIILDALATCDPAYRRPDARLPRAAVSGADAAPGGEAG